MSTISQTVGVQAPINSQKTIGVQAFINSHKLSSFQFLIFGLCFLILVLDGYDTVVVGYIAPALRKQWEIGPAQLAPMFGAGLFGLTLGSFLFGPLADRFGRKVILIVSVVLFGILSLLSAYSTSIAMLIALRFLTGLGLGGAMPNAYTMAAEFCPDRLRSSLVAPIGCGIAVGGAIGGVFASKVIGLYGWPAMLVLGGALPLLLVPILWKLLPESARYLVTTGKDPAVLTRTMQRLAPKEDLADTTFVIDETRLTGFPVKQLFRPGLFGGTVLLWITAFMALLVIYFLGNWLPILINGTGIPLERASLMTAMYLTGNSLGAILLGYCMDRMNPQYVLAVAFALAGIALASFGHVIHVPALALFALFVTGTGTGGTMTGTNILSTMFYPTTTRATGVSWTLAMGRVGSVVGSMIGGVLLAAKWGTPRVFAAMSIPVFVGAISVSALSVYRARKGKLALRD